MNKVDVIYIEWRGGEGKEFAVIDIETKTLIDSVGYNAVSCSDRTQPTIEMAIDIFKEKGSIPKNYKLKPSAKSD